MFALTFLGHQGWLVSSATTNLLIDPLLTEGFGHGGVGRVYPPRTLDLAEFPPIDAVVLTHEHDDHFDVPSLARIDPRVPIHLSSRSSRAARELLDSLGFTVHALEPGASRVIGDLRYRSEVCDHQRGGGQGDEWDVAPMVVEELGGHGRLWSSIDVAALPSSLDRPPSVWIHAHNATRSGYQARAPARFRPEADTGLVLAAALRRAAAVEAAVGGAPAATLVVGQGWSFAGEQAWIDHEAFPVSPEEVARALALADPAGLVRAPAPGFTLEFVDGRLVGVAEQRPFLAALPREGWPDRGFAPLLGPRPDYGPASGIRACSPAELDALVAELADFARHLYAGPVFRALMSLPGEIDGHPPAVGFAVRIGEGESRVQLRYEPSGCCFVRDDVTPLLAGIEAWASDLLGFVRGELGPSALCYAGRLRQWSGPPSCPIRFPVHELWVFGHPLRRPEQAATLYQRLRTEALAEPIAARVPARPGESD